MRCDEVNIPAFTLTSPHMQYARTLEYVHGVAFPSLPPLYTELIATIGGYPMFGLGYYDREGFSFLPPSPMEVLSPNVSGEDDNWVRPNKTGPTHCPHAFFCGYDLSDLEGWVFIGNDVWLMERGMVSEHVGSFFDWFSQILDQSLARLDVSEDELDAFREAVKEEPDPHRLYDYSLETMTIPATRTAEDLALQWVCHQAGSPYSYGVFQDGAWAIEMGKRFLSVRPFTAGAAEVILAGEGASYGGPWVKIDATGKLIT